MQTIHDWKSAAAGDDHAAGGETRSAVAGEPRAPASAFAGRDDQRLINEIATEIGTADHSGIRLMREIIMGRMDRGDLSSVSAMRLLQECGNRASAIARGST